MPGLVDIYMLQSFRATHMVLRGHLARRVVSFGSVYRQGIGVRDVGHTAVLFPQA